MNNLFALIDYLISRHDLSIADARYWAKQIIEECEASDLKSLIVYHESMYADLI